MGYNKTKVNGIAPSGLADARFSKTQQRVMGFLFGQPDRSFFAKELIELTGGGTGAIQREIKKLTECGLITMTRMGNQKHYKANPASPIFGELCQITSKTFGLTVPLQEALVPLADSVQVAFIYGSVAKSADHALSDVDLMIVSDEIDYADVYAHLEPVSQSIKRSVNPTIMTRRVFVEKLSSGSPFLRKVMERPKIFIIGGESDVPS